MKLPEWNRLPENMQTESVRFYYDILAKKKASLSAKRVFDAAGSAGLLVALAPVFAGIAAWIKHDSSGPVIYKQERVTSFGRRFSINKFRTMVTGADKIGSLVTVENDSRITKSGEFLRRYRLDELPQLINILKGDMSFVGTRPEVPKYVEAYTPEMLATLLMPAGVTSQASIKYKDEDRLLKDAANADETYINDILPDKMKYNLESLKDFSFFNDIKTMLQTVFAVAGLGGSDSAENDGAYIGSSVIPPHARQEGEPRVSVVMPVYREEKYIRGCIESLLEQDYPLDDIEFIFVDGCSDDDTPDIIREFSEKYPGKIFLFDNPDKTVPYAMNIGLRHSRGEFIVRLDAHAQYAREYISKCIHCLETTDAANVGGIAETKSHGYIGGAIATMLSSKFGVGNSDFRTNGKSGYVDTVPFGAFRREIFEKLGGYDERLTRNQDNEMNWRIRKNGGKIYLSDDIHLSYFCRDTVKGIAKMALQNGKWNVITMKLCPGSMGVRHFIPLAFTASLVGVPAFAALLSAIFSTQIGWKLFAAELLLYAGCDIAFSIKDSEAKYIPAVAALFPVFHVAYGCGSMEGILKLKNLNSAPVPKTTAHN